MTLKQIKKVKNKKGQNTLYMTNHTIYFKKSDDF